MGGSWYAELIATPPHRSLKLTPSGSNGEGGIELLTKTSMAGYLPVFDSPQSESSALTAYDSVLRRWSVPFVERDIDTSFGSTHVVIAGPEKAVPVVLLHGLFATAMSWYRNVSVLSQEYRIHAVDVMGEANKSRPTKPITSLDDFLQWFTELIDRLGVQHLYLVGNSFGGFTGAYFAMHLPDRVRKLVLIGPAATFCTMPRFYLHMFFPKLLYMLLPWLPGRKRVMRRASRWMHAGLTDDGLWSELFVQLMMHGRMTSQVLPRIYSPEEFARIQVPTLLLVGERERIYSPHRVAASAKRLMPTIHVRIVPAAHHVSAVANPEAVNTILRDFFQGSSVN